MKRSCFPVLLIPIAIIAIVILRSALYTIDETEQVVITRFGEPIGEAITTAGLHFKMPVLHQVNRFDKRILEWDGPPEPAPTQDKLYIVLDTFARWRITDPLTYLRAVRDERTAQSRLDGILKAELRSAIARHQLIEVVRTTKDRVPVVDESLGEVAEEIATLEPITRGRSAIEQDIFKSAAPKVTNLGIELLDIRFKRINYDNDVLPKIFERMTSERKQIAELFRSEGQGEAAKIIGDKERDVLEIESEAYRRVQIIRGAADAQATTIYAEAYNQSPAALEFYRFLKTLEAYEQTMDQSTSLILSTSSPFYRTLQTAGELPEGSPAAEIALPPRPPELDTIPIPTPQATPEPTPEPEPDPEPEQVEEPAQAEEPEQAEDTE
jgi:modulator of FtsH protease HflC